MTINRRKILTFILILYIISIFLKNPTALMLNFGKTDSNFELSDKNQYLTNNDNINSQPESPQINGPNNGQVGIIYSWTFCSYDPEEDNISYYIDWGDECGAPESNRPQSLQEKKS